MTSESPSGNPGCGPSAGCLAVAFAAAQTLREGAFSAAEIERRGHRGFTLVEMIVVLGVLAVLVGTAVPLASAVIDGQRRDEVRTELAAIASALEGHWFDRQAFPSTLRDPTFYGVYLQPGVGGSTVQDGWGGNVDYLYSVNAAAHTATVYSRGENGVDNGLANEQYSVVVYAAVPGLQKTRQRLRVIVEALANHIEAGGALTGTWSADRAALGLGAEYDNDGFGTPFTLAPATLTLRSAGPDGILGTADDVTS